MERDIFIRQTIDWLNRRIAPAGVIVDADTPLFERGIVDSLGILRLIAWTEKQIGRRIGDREIRMDRFASVRLIATSFVRDFVAERALAGSAHSAGILPRAERRVAAERLTAERACARCGRCALSGTAACPRRAA